MTVARPAEIARTEAEVASRTAQARYLALFNAIDQGFCTIEVAFDAEDRPVDYRFLEVSPSFEEQTGIANAAGRWMREIAPDHDQSWFDIYGKIARTGEPERFEDFSTPLGRWWEVFAFRLEEPDLRRVGILFRDITARKRADAALRESEERQAFLLELSDRLRSAADPEAAMAVAGEMFARRTGLAAAHYLLFHADQESFDVIGGYSDGRLPEHLTRGSGRLSDHGPHWGDQFRRGETIFSDDHTTRSEADAAASLALGIRSGSAVPLMRDGRLVAIFSTANPEPRHWTDAEKTLQREVAERTWAAVERARAEAALRDSETKFRALFDNMAEGFALFDVVRGPDGQIIDLIYREANKALEHQAGFDRAKTIGRPLTALLTPSDAARFIPVLARAVDPGEPITVEEYAEVVDRWFEVSAYPHGPDKVAAFYRNISERKHAEKALRVSQEQFETLLDHAPMGVYLVDGDFTILQVNPVAQPVFGDIPGGPVGRDFDEIIHILWDATYADELVRIFRHTLETGESYETPERAEYRADLHIFEYYEWRLDRILLPGDRYGVVCYFRDISAQVEARKEIERAREAARESEERQAFLLELSDALRPLSDPAEIQTTAMRSLAERLDVIRAGYFELAADQDTFSLTARWERDTDPLPERMLLSSLGADIREAYYAGRTFVIRNTEQDASTAEDRAIFRAIGVKAWIGVPLVKGERLLAAVGVHSRVPRDWTPSELRLVEDVAERTWAAVERARAEEVLRDREAELARTQRIAQVASVDVALNGSPVGHRSPEYRRLHGLPPDRAVESHLDWLARLHPEDRARADREFNAAIESGDSYETEYRIVRLDDDQERWIGAKAVIERDAEGKATRLLGSHIDITELKRADAALRESEARLQSLIEGMPQLIWRAINGGRWTWASPQWTEYTGQAEADSHAFGWLDPVHPDDRAGVCENWTKAVEQGEFRAECRINHRKEERYRWFHTRARPVRDDSGTIVEWLGTSTDVDELRELQDRQQVLVAELQHRARNILTVVRSVFSRTMEAGGELGDISDHFRGRLDALARTQVVTTRSAEGTADLEDLIRDELLSVGVTDGERVTIEGPDVTLPARAVESIGLAIHELTTNALKYGALKGDDGTLDIRWVINIAYRGARRLVLTWREQGVAALVVKPTRHGFGTELITEALPYRLGAETKLEFLGGGIRCTIDVPLPESDGAAGAA